MTRLRMVIGATLLATAIIADTSVAASAPRRPRLVRKVPTSVAGVYSCRLAWPGGKTNPDYGLFPFAHRYWDYISHLKVRKMGCRRALRVMHHATLKWTNGPNLYAHGFQCHDIDPGSGGGTIQCMHATRAFRLTIYT